MDKEEIKRLVGERVRKYRLCLKMSQFTLGEKVGINQRQIAQIECGKSLPSLNTLIRFSEIFHCEISEFFEQRIVKAREELKQEINNVIDSFDYRQMEFIYSFLKWFSMLTNENGKCFYNTQQKRRLL